MENKYQVLNYGTDPGEIRYTKCLEAKLLTLGLGCHTRAEFNNLFVNSDFQRQKELTRMVPLKPASAVSKVRILGKEEFLRQKFDDSYVAEVLGSDWIDRV
ncbi:MAG: hypothetical protein LBP33_03920 [Candidatus Adiutrix sp.]|jgi:hypothetical protein|nr:hypothetical protein [Candidatus Adiutrix sp.]